MSEHADAPEAPETAKKFCDLTIRDLSGICKGMDGCGQCESLNPEMFRWCKTVKPCWPHSWVHWMEEPEKTPPRKTPKIRRGEWYFNYELNKLTCSVCGASAETMTEHCPMCGAVLAAWD